MAHQLLLRPFTGRVYVPQLSFRHRHASKSPINMHVHLSHPCPSLCQVLKGHTGRVNAVTFSTRDGNLITGSCE